MARRKRKPDFDPAEWVEQTNKENNILKSDIEKRRAQKAKRHVERQYRALIEEYEDAKRMLELTLELKKYKPKPTKIRPKKRNGDEAIACAVASDWHVEETVDPKSINNLNEFNLTIAEARIKKFFENAAALTTHHGRGVDIRILCLMILGDIINGYIHDEFLEDNNLSPVQAIVWVQDLIIGGIKYLLDNCDVEKIIVPCCNGNHDRTTKQRKVARYAANSFSWLLYQNLRRYFADEERIEFHIADGYHLYLDMYGYTIRMHHGDNVRYGGGIGGLSVPLNKAINGWNKSKTAYLDVLGHYHTLKCFGNAIINGSLIGYNAFALSIKAGYEEPKQAFFLIKNGRGLTTFEPIFLD